MKRFLHMAVILGAFLFAGCTAEPVPAPEGPSFRLTLRCGDSVMTKAAKDGDDSFHENLIQSVDFLFYPGENPSEETDAVYHVRQEPGKGDPVFNLVIKKDYISVIFPGGDQTFATVYALVNYSGTFEDLSKTSRKDLSRTRLVTDFADTETDYIQPGFLMDGSTVIKYLEEGNPNATGEIDVRRFASKLSVALNLPDEVVLKHEDPQYRDEYWSPVPHTARIYLIDGFKSVLLSESGQDTEPDWFSYKGSAHARPYARENGEPYFNIETVQSITGQKNYYHTWPMYTYPGEWSSRMWDYSQVDYLSGTPHEQPYFKLEMDWRREARNGYTYDRRKYYYKIFMPFERFTRNNWYGFYLDVSVLGSETDEGQALLEPTCYLLDWQNKALAVNKYAVISKARYLSLDKSSWEINNMESLTIPFLSSHNVTVVEGSVHATRPYYAEITKENPVGSYNSKLHGWIRAAGDGTYYLDFEGQPEGNEQYEPSSWLTNTSTSIVLDHPLQNDYGLDDFDYSPYTITLDINHTDLVEDKTSHTYGQYLQHITIVQYPAIYIQKLRNSDTSIIRKSGDNPYGYADGEAPWLDKPWGYVYVNGGRFIRWDRKTASESEDPFFTLTTANCKREYQWQTVWYTGGSQDMFDVHVTVLPKKSSFVIGDPREDTVNNLNDKDGTGRYKGLYEFTVDGSTAQDRWNNMFTLENIRTGTTEYQEAEPGVWKRTGFNVAKALYGDEEYRSLKWYYPADTTAARTENMLAPSFRFASKFGGTEYGNGFFGDITKEYAEYRCAAYQEDGFPAGRWRLPTKAEIHFIAQLSAKKAFEPLFSNVTYWSANGAITVNGSSVSDSGSTTALLRCVYDSWYWDKVDGKEGDPRHNPRDEFVWGDKER